LNFQISAYVVLAEIEIGQVPVGAEDFASHRLIVEIGLHDVAG
jgi:hypothetical protein